MGGGQGRSPENPKPLSTISHGTILLCLRIGASPTRVDPGKMVLVRALRVTAMVVYASYLTNVGLLLLLLPWSDGWVRLILLTPPPVAAFLDAPVVRGLVSAFGFLHLVLLLAELLRPPQLLR
jgi:hypothetical protein